MEKTGDDIWTTQPPSIKSSFWLSSPREPQPGIFYSNLCGFGWRFGVSISDQLDDTITGSSGHDIPPKATIDLIFEPHLTKMANLGQLTVSVSTEGLVRKTDESKLPFTISLPVRLEWERYCPLGTYFLFGNAVERPRITFQVEFSSTLGLSLPNSPAPQVQQALTTSIFTGADIVDTKFYLFSRRSREGRKTQPKPVFASSTLLRGHSPYLDSLLFPSGFKESATLDIHTSPHDSLNFSDDHYDHDSDSDLDSDTDNDGPLPRFMNQASRPTSDASFYSTLSVPPADSKFDRTYVLEDQDEKSSPRPGTFVLIPDTAHKTWRALVWYLYTREIYFSPLSSENKETGPEQKTPAHPTACSPKSMYRLADKLGIPELQMLALDGIRSSLSVRNILTEVFSRYTSMYTEVQKMESGVFIGLFPSLSDDEFDRARTQLVEGDLPHSSDALGVIIRELMKRIESSKANKSPGPSHRTFSTRISYDSVSSRRHSRRRSRSSSMRTPPIIIVDPPLMPPPPVPIPPIAINVSRTPSPPLVSIVAPQPTTIQQPPIMVSPESSSFAHAPRLLTQPTSWETFRLPPLESTPEAPPNPTLPPDNTPGVIDAGVAQSTQIRALEADRKGGGQTIRRKLASWSRKLPNFKKWISRT